MVGLSEFGLDESGSLITNIVVDAWGCEICFECKYLLDKRLRYKIHFLNCEKIDWFINSPERKNQIDADIIFFDFGRKNHEKEASIHTDIFTADILYGDLKIEKNW
ncbi:hypothetical protein BI308_04000 [Roseofilum reptotaenium AO1-A]|uniref:Uncharacterized protein n=1 Tax=Roseofilum reptotaenium AO1-A TaxID=1925591 RepID=A0A1L9QW24_9CYAN|nr:hypothetical protein [Roseofilum reptotaenium]OJJ26863.1 hypothetical protein BI308_04000 [Roseofilum reptotaenium AO1-A]